MFSGGLWLSLEPSTPAPTSPLGLNWGCNFAPSSAWHDVSPNSSDSIHVLRCPLTPRWPRSSWRICQFPWFRSYSETFCSTSSTQPTVSSVINVRRLNALIHSINNSHVWPAREDQLTILGRPVLRSGAIRRHTACFVCIFFLFVSCDGQAELSPQGTDWNVAADQRLAFAVMLDSVARRPGRWRWGR